MLDSDRPPPATVPTECQGDYYLTHRTEYYEFLTDYWRVCFLLNMGSRSQFAAYFADKRIGLKGRI
jgi:hypothetical protein